MEEEIYPYEFSEDFLFGAASSAYQIEGAYKEDGKGWHIWDHHVNHDHQDLEKANVACDSYHKLEEDVKLLKGAGFEYYRFSINWTRILPNGFYKSGEVNQKGINYYRKLINELKKNNIEPMVTIYHWDLPHYLQKHFGGWTHPLVVDYMRDYADVLFSHFGDLVKWWITINEPTLIVFGYENGQKSKMAPEKSIPSPGNYLVIHHMLLAHAQIYRLYDEKYREKQQGNVGISLVGTAFRPKEPGNPSDEEAVKLAYQFFLGIYAHPIFTKEGDYPELVRQTVDCNSLDKKKEGRTKSRLPSFTDEEKKSLIGAADFFGVNHYLTELCSMGKSGTTGSVVVALKSVPLYDSDLSRSDDNPDAPKIKHIPPFVEDIKLDTTVLNNDPTGFREILKYIKDNYGNPKILVTENGFGVEGETDEKWQNDQDRIDYFKGFLKELWKAIYVDNCNVVGYTVWCLMDNFEWSRGYKMKYGIVHVEFGDNNRPRKPKRSYGFFKTLIEKRIIPLDF